MIIINRLQETGDTIVEVLIAIAIVSLILGGAYASSRQSLNTTQQTQERGEASKYAQEQLERLKAAANAPNAAIFTESGPFCLDEELRIVVAPSSCPTGPDNRYRPEIQRGTNPFDVNNQRTFTISIVWDKSGGNGSDQVVMVYRVHPNGN